MAEIDMQTKEYMSDPERFADVFNYYLYDGRQVIDPKKLQVLDTSQVAHPYGEDGTSEAVERYRDVLKSASAMYDDQAAYLILGIENQAKVHYAMPVRNMLYDAMEYTRQVKEAASLHRQERKQGTGQNVSPSEFLSGFYKNDRLRPVITLVIYWSPDEWTAPLCVHDMLSVQDPSLLAFVPNYKMNLIAPRQMTEADFEKFRTTLAEAFQYIKYSNDDAALEEMLETHPKFNALDRRTAELINTVTNSQLPFIQPKEDIDMCRAIENMQRKAVEAALADTGIAVSEIKQEATEAGEFKAQLASIQKMMKTLNLSQEQAMDVLEIPADKREAYIQQL